MSMSSKARKKYRPDYGMLYPDVEVSKDVLIALKESDCKIEYAEYDLKRERLIVDSETGAVTVIPSREDSLERLLDQDKQFRDERPSLEELVVEALYTQELRQKLHQCLAMLDADERALVRALFFMKTTEREYAKCMNLSKTAIHARKIKILDKLRLYLDA
ncbi:sigma-70 family RNA polymerase sigma factor [Ruminococcaceae bacterium OttesenSCG-928-L11]|nr:sigma-70 family RNA polymerase sigma factor [Ruminococcaceae bacterium OttesenSCG-928-L11]